LDEDVAVVLSEMGHWFPFALFAERNMGPIAAHAEREIFRFEDPPPSFQVNRQRGHSFSVHTTVTGCDGPPGLTSKRTRTSRNPARLPTAV